MEAAAKTLNRGDRPAPTIADPASAPTATFEAEERAGVDREHGATEDVIPRQAIAERVRQREHPVAHGNIRQDVIDQLGGPGGHPPAPTTGTEPAAFARKRHERLGMTAVALKTGKAPGPHAAVQEAAKLLLEERGESGGIGAGGGREKGLQVLAHHLMEHGALRMAGCGSQGRNGRRTMLAGRGFVSHDDVMTVADGDGIAASR